MKSTRADWAASSPWSGIQGKPSYLGENGVPWSSILNIPSQDAPGGLATVAFTGRYSDLLGRPSFGSAAMADISNFATAAQGIRADSALQEDLSGRNITGGLFQDMEQLAVAVQALSGPGAISLTEPATDLTTTGVADALTLADATVFMFKTITHVVDGGSAVLTPDTAVGFTTITFTNLGESALLRWTAAGWAVVALFGAVAA